MELMPPNIAGIERRIWASACIVTYHGDVTPEYVISRDPFVGLLGMNDELECLNCSPVVQIHVILHDAYGKLRSEYRMGHRYLYAIPYCLPYLRHVTGIIYCLWNFRRLQEII